MYRSILALLFSFSFLTVFAQEKLFKIDYKLALSSETLTQADTAEDSSLALLAAMAAAFGEDDTPQVEAWINQNFIRVETQGIMQNNQIQITNRNTNDSYTLYPSMQAYTKTIDATDKVNIHETEDDMVVISTADLPIRFVADTSKTIAGLPCKLAVLEFDSDEFDASLTQDTRLEIWYNETLPSLYWGEYAYLKNIPGAALYIGAFGIGIEASAVHEVDFDSSLFEIPEDYTLQEDIYALSFFDMPLGHDLYAFQDSTSHLIGIRDDNQQVIMAPKYASINEFVGTHAIVTNSDFQYGIIDTNGQEVIPCTWEYLALDPELEIIFFSTDGKTGVMDYNQQIVIPAQYDHISFFSKGLALFSEDGKTGLIDLNGTIVLPANFESIMEYDESHIIIMENERYYVVDIQSQQKTTAGHDYLLLANEDDLVVALQDNKYGYITKDGKIAIPFKYEYATPFYDGIAAINETDDEDVLYINTKGEYVQMKETE
ncbi:WG repeat-containing protein [Sphingobacterium chuzhouense]|uniref:WG repeat-containing protein n=1 Tax=Sphingobacterium chuzhouense TaxID=1742264 RepID=A0ABR7XNE0_9SPHI|nr:WG repeat-containing protein [Sphingobacterium chuzhouense]MBD1420689.1 WG repeat-containing protein [Sphingobacterium chuzhouense]